MRSSSTATPSCVNFATADNSWMLESSGNHTARSGCATGGLRQRREFHAAANGIDALRADTDAVAEFPDVAGLRVASAGLFLFPGLVCRGTLRVPAPGNDCVVLLAVKNVLAGEFLDAVDGDHAFDENFRQLDEETEFLHRGNQRVVFLAKMLLHELRGFPGHQFALGGFGAALGLGRFRRNGFEFAAAVRAERG